MQVQAINENQQSFSGRVIVIGENSRKTLKNIAKEINKMKIVKNNDRNIFIGEFNMKNLFVRDFYNTNKHSRQVVVFASNKNSKDKKLINDMYFNGISTVKNSQTLISATKRALKHTEPKQNLKTVTKEKNISVLQKIKNFIKNIIN